MPGHDLIVVGGSAGGIEAVSQLVAGLPPDLPAAVCVVVHMAAYMDSRLPEVLARAASLPVVAAQTGMPLRPGTIYVCIPGLHMMIEQAGSGGVIRLTSGPKENRTRPAVDPLFRSAALAFGPRVIGVVLSGALDDGTAGLWAIRDRGGLAVVQEPKDAAVMGMPNSALHEVGADHVAPARQLGPLLARLAREPVVAKQSNGTHGDGDSPGPRDDLEREIQISMLDERAHEQSDRPGAPSRFVCPDCGGVLWDVTSKAGPLRFRCETGHAYGPATLAEGQIEGVEAAMWAALRALEDRAALAELRATTAEDRGLEVQAQAFMVQAQAAQEHATVLRAMLRLDGRSGIRPSTVDPSAMAD